MIRGSRPIIDHAAIDRGLEVTTSIEINLTNEKSIQEFEDALLAPAEVADSEPLGPAAPGRSMIFGSEFVNLAGS